MDSRDNSNDSSEPGHAVPSWERLDAEQVDTGWSDGGYPDEMQEIRTRVHRRLLERLNLANLSERDQEEAEDEVRKIVRDLLASEETPLNLEEHSLHPGIIRPRSSHTHYLTRRIHQDPLLPSNAVRSFHHNRQVQLLGRLLSLVDRPTAQPTFVEIVGCSASPPLENPS